MELFNRWEYNLPSVLTFESHFIRLYNEDTLELTEELLRSYTSAYRKKEMMKEISNKEEDQAQVVQIEPRGIQLEALYEIEKAREEGIEKGLLVSATGDRVIIVTGCINALVSRVSETFIKNNSCIA